MFRIGFSMAMVVLVAMPALAEDDAKHRQPKHTTAVPVNELLKRMAHSTLGSGEAELLKAIADLIERETTADSQRTAVTQANATQRTKPIPAPTQSAAAPIPTEIEQRERFLIRLSYASAAEVARAIQDHLRSERQSPADDPSSAPAPRTILVPVPVVNGILISSTPQGAKNCADLISQFDDPPRQVVIDAWCAEILPPMNAAQPNTAEGNNASAAEEPDREEAPANWIAWATKHRRVKVFSRPQIRTLENQQAGIVIGCDVPRFTGSQFAELTSDSGLSLELTSTVSPEGLIILKCDAKCVWYENNKHSSAPVRRTTTAQTTLSAKTNQTVWLEGLTWDGKRQTIIALTPREHKKD